MNILLKLVAELDLNDLRRKVFKMITLNKENLNQLIYRIKDKDEVI